jgi:hypothetical protein
MVLIYDRFYKPFPPCQTLAKETLQQITKNPPGSAFILENRHGDSMRGICLSRIPSDPNGSVPFNDDLQRKQRGKGLN